MATLRQVVDMLDDILCLPKSAARGHAQRLQASGILSATQGTPSHIGSDSIAAVIVSIAVGSPLVGDYLTLLPGNGGPSFGKVLARFIEEPNELLEVEIDTLAPGASVTFRGSDHGVQSLAFYQSEPHQRPAYSRDVRLGPEIFVRLAAAIAKAPEVRAGRPRLRDRFKRN